MKTPEEILADGRMNELSERLKDLYTRTTIEMEDRIVPYFAQFEQQNAIWEQQLAAGEITQRQFNALRRDAVLQGEQWLAVRDRAALELTNTDELAAQMINGETPAFFAEAYNYDAFRTELLCTASGYDLAPFTLYNEDAVRILMAEDPDLLPPLTVDRARDLDWNRAHIQQAIAQGIVQGDSMDRMAARLQQVSNMDYNAAMRNARTAAGAARHAGQDAAARRAVDAGVPMVKQWNATMDNRTRDSHLMMDGEEAEIGQPFSNGLEYPNDPSGPPEEVYNCRCGYMTFIRGVDHSHDLEGYQEWMQQNYYEDWAEQRARDQRSGRAFEREETRRRRDQIQQNARTTPAAPAVDPNRTPNGMITEEAFMAEAQRQGLNGAALQAELEDYVASSYGGISLGDEISEFIEEAPPELLYNGGTLYRGMTFDNRQDYERFVNSHQIGGTLETRRSSLSWTASENVAEQFSTEVGDYAVVLINNDTDRLALGIQNIADTPITSEEVLWSNQVDFTIKRIEERDGAVYMYIEQNRSAKV